MHPLRPLAQSMAPRFAAGWSNSMAKTSPTRSGTEEVSRAASQVAVHPPVRQALLELQHRSRRAPGLVADGRDMGTVVFPDAVLKVYLTASVAARADRRHKQLIEKGFSTNIANLSQELEARDRRDAERSTAPLRPAEDAYRLDSSELSIDEVVAQVLNWYAGRGSRLMAAQSTIRRFERQYKVSSTGCSRDVSVCGRQPVQVFPLRFFNSAEAQGRSVNS